MKEFYSISMDHRVKKLLFQATHRGTREGDLILGNFVQKYLQEFTKEDIQEMEEILALSDKEIETLLRTAPSSPLLNHLRRFHDEELSHIIQHPNDARHNSEHERDR